MLLGARYPHVSLLRHAVMGGIGAGLVYLVWKLNGTWSPDMRLWKAFGGAAFFLLWFAVFIGPVSRLWKGLVRFVPWRREAGIWVAVLGLVHGYLVLDGWVRWSAWSLLGYAYIPELETYLRSEPGFGLANLMGLLALLFIVILAATSFDKAVAFLGIGSWKWLHGFAYVAFYVIALHVVYFAFIHFTPSPERVLMGLPTNYPPNPLRFYYLAAILSVFLAQASAFAATVRRERGFRK